MSVPIKGWAVADQPREKFVKLGYKQMTNSELLAIIINNGSSGQSAMDIARSCLNQYGNSLRALYKSNVKEISSLKGIGKVTAIRICAALALGDRLQYEQETVRTKVASSSDAFAVLYPLVGNLEKEEFWILLLNRANLIIGKEKISIGGVSGTVVDTKIIFKTALSYLASSIIVCHNHPSGQVNPSEEDKHITKKIARAAHSLDIRLLDHLIIGDQKYYSFADEGII